MKERCHITNGYAANSRGFGTYNYIVEDEPTGNLYIFYYDYSASKLLYKKSLNGGRTWGAEVEVRSAAASAIHCIAIWYDGWTATNGSKIDVVWSEAGTVYHKQITTATDSMSSLNTIHATGYNTVSSSAISITRSRGGNLYCLYTTNGSSLGEGFRKSTDEGANWTSCTNGNEGSTDTYIMLPDYQTDSNDVMCIYWDSSALEISLKRYDDSADSWAETSISTSVSYMNQQFGLSSFNAITDYANNQNILVHHTNPSTGSQNIKVFTITASAVNSKTNLYSNTSSSLNQLPSLSLVGNTLYGFYLGQPTLNVSGMLSIVYKTSTDRAANWSAAVTNLCITLMSSATVLYYCPRSYSSSIHLAVMTFSGSTNHNQIGFIREIKTPTQSFNM